MNLNGMRNFGPSSWRRFPRYAGCWFDSGRLPVFSVLVRVYDVSWPWLQGLFILRPRPAIASLPWKLPPDDC